ncbi:hypothetical protein SAMN05443637_13512 [Pseudonocardia thermophila]|jgi:hypothetical protein|uniref:Uncharacterized protein n=1 Tax=Pseudonocardia thermophila TaxID=1848 RepID=A0A1M7BEJ7_PSETH|nr:hypothetical protein [Pseudonocardia thermophila]SHL53039.1 hypothetical protein SAMN05443637_13512 [Pseudonocardia thermophila]
MFAPVPGVPAAPPAFGLVASAERPDPAQLPNWELGLVWVPERCATEYRLAPACVAADPADYRPPRPAEAVYYRPVDLQLAEECSTLSGPVDEARLRRIAEAQTPFAVARELWSGAGTQADPFDSPAGSSQTNPYLASAAATEVSGSPAASVRLGIGLLEQAAMEAAAGQQVFLHVPVMMLPQLGEYVYRVGQVLYTLAGNVVIADGGYEGTGPSGEPVGATAWAYATSPVSVLMSPLEITSGPESIDHATNTRTAWASRVVAALFDPCVHLAIEIEL